MAQFKLYDKVRGKYQSYTGYIDTITPQGKIRVRTDKGYEWTTASQIKLISEEQEKETKKTDIRFFG